MSVPTPEPEPTFQAALSPAEVALMQRAADVAAQGWGATFPNPVVGCVLVDEAGIVVAEGWHQRAGGPHAEVHALQQAGARARGTTAIVTLEPCNHQGRTGPCTQALIDAGVRRVVVGVSDPHDLASGGIQRLREAGIDVVLADGAAHNAAREVNLPWLRAMERGYPYVTWKFAGTLDGFCAAEDDTSQWITSEAAREDVHVMRARSDAIMVGVGTVIADDPALTVRHQGQLAERQPLRVIVDAQGVTPAGAQVRNDAAPTWIATGAELPLQPDGRVDLFALLKVLHMRDIRHVFLEGGPRLAAGFLRAGLIDEVLSYVAPMLLGAGRSVIADWGVQTLTDGLRLESIDATMLGPDVRIRSRLR